MQRHARTCYVLYVLRVYVLCAAISYRRIVRTQHPDSGRQVRPDMGARLKRRCWLPSSPATPAPTRRGLSTQRRRLGRTCSTRSTLPRLPRSRYSRLPLTFTVNISVDCAQLSAYSTGVYSYPGMHLACCRSETGSNPDSGATAPP